jgi:hypothetical protein
MPTSTISKFCKQQEGVIMKAVKQWITNCGLNRVLVMLLAGVLVFLNVACSSSDVASPAGKRMSSNPSSLNNAGTDQRKISDTYNGFPDSDPKVQGETRALVDNAKKNAKNPKGFVDSVNTAAERTRNLPKSLADQAEQQKDDLVKVTKRDMRNLKNNLEKASDEVPKVFGEAKENAKRGVENSLQFSEDTSNVLKNNIQETLK